MDNDLRSAWERVASAYVALLAAQRDLLSHKDRLFAFREELRSASPGRASGHALSDSTNLIPFAAAAASLRPKRA